MVGEKHAKLNVTIAGKDRGIGRAIVLEQIAAENIRAFFQDFGVDVRAQVPRHGIDSLVFLFNADGESRQHSPTHKYFG